MRSRRQGARCTAAAARRARRAGGWEPSGRRAPPSCRTAVTRAGARAQAPRGRGGAVRRTPLGRQNRSHPSPGPARGERYPGAMQLPVRGERARALGIALPPRRMAPLRGTRPLKRWRYVGYYAADLMLCVGVARIGAVPQRWWAVALPDGSLRERTTVGRGGIHLDGARVRVEADDVRIDLQLDERDGVEVVSPAGNAYIWTRKQA